MRSRGSVLPTLSIVLVVVAIGAGGAAVRAAQPTTKVRDDVVRALARDRDVGKVEVSVEEGRVVLRGDVSTLWAKTQAIARALKVDGVKEVASELTVAKGENDKDLAERVMKVMQGYEHYTVWDYLSGGVRNGVVTLRGKVTSFPDKSKDLAERISKIRGVQELRNELKVLNPSRGDDELRARLAQQIFSHPSFDTFATMPNPPFHIVVDNGVVTLIGYVQTQAEVIELTQLASQTMGILRIENQLQTVAKR